MGAVQGRVRRLAGWGPGHQEVQPPPRFQETVHGTEADLSEHQGMTWPM